MQIRCRLAQTDIRPSSRTIALTNPSTLSYVALVHQSARISLSLYKLQRLADQYFLTKIYYRRLVINSGRFTYTGTTSEVPSQQKSTKIGSQMPLQKL